MSGNTRTITKEELIKAEAELFLSAQRLAIEHPKVFAKMFFEALIKKGDMSVNPFAFLFAIHVDINGEECDTDKRLWGDLAGIVLNKIDGIEVVRKEYVPLTQIIEENFYFDVCFYSLTITQPPNLEQMKRRILSELEERLAISVLCPCWLINQGVPIYKQNDLEEFSKVPDSDNDFIYLFMTGKYSESGHTGQYPEWAKKYFFKNEHLGAHRRLFDGFDGDEESLLLRRTAFRTHIGESDVIDGKQKVEQEKLVQAYRPNSKVIVQPRFNQLKNSDAPSTRWRKAFEYESEGLDALYDLIERHYFDDDGNPVYEPAQWPLKKNLVSDWLSGRTLEEADTIITSSNRKGKR